MTRTEFHVVPDGVEWLVEHSGRPLERHHSKAAAVAAANVRAHRVQPSMVMVHDQDREVDAGFSGAAWVGRVRGRVDDHG